MNGSINRLYYQVKPIIPRYLQISARRVLAKAKMPYIQNVWPIFEPAGNGLKIG